MQARCDIPAELNQIFLKQRLSTRIGKGNFPSWHQGGRGEAVFCPQHQGVPLGVVVRGIPEHPVNDIVTLAIPRAAFLHLLDNPPETDLLAGESSMWNADLIDVLIAATPDPGTVDVHHDIRLLPAPGRQPIHDGRDLGMDLRLSGIIVSAVVMRLTIFTLVALRHAVKVDKRHRENLNMHSEPLADGRVRKRGIEDPLQDKRTGRFSAMVPRCDEKPVVRPGIHATEPIGLNRPPFFRPAEIELPAEG